MINRITCIFSLLLLSYAAPAKTPTRTNSAQHGDAALTGSSTLHGTVRDNSGALIPGALVTLFFNNGQKLTATTEENGNYSFRRLVPGAYMMTVDFPGMQPLHSMLLKVKAGHPLSADMIMLQTTVATLSSTALANGR